MVDQVTLWPEVNNMNLLLSDLPNHEVECAQQFSIMNWMWYVEDWAQAGPESTGYMKWYKCPWSPLIIHCLRFPSLHLWPHGEFPMINWQKQQRLGPGLQMILHDCRYHSKVDSSSTTVSFGDIPEGQWWKNFSQWAKLWASHWLFTLLGRRNVIMYQFMGCGQWLAGQSGTWKELDWKIGDREIWGRGMQIELSEGAKTIKIFVSHMNADQRPTSAEEDINN